MKSISRVFSNAVSSIRDRYREYKEVRAAKVHARDPRWAADPFANARSNPLFEGHAKGGVNPLHRADDALAVTCPRYQSQTPAKPVAQAPADLEFANPADFKPRVLTESDPFNVKVPQDVKRLLA